MRKRAWIMFALSAVLLLSACGKQERKENDVVSISDYYPCYIAESDQGYYYWERSNIETGCQRLMFWDKGSGKVVPLCNKPECDHGEDDCNASYAELWEEEYVFSKGYLQYYEGLLYTVGYSKGYVVLYQMDADGSGKWKVCMQLYRADAYETVKEWTEPDVIIHEGYAYFVDREQASAQLVRMKLGEEKQETVAAQDEGISNDIYRMKVDGDYLFYQTITFYDDNLEKYNGGICCYNVQTGENALVKEGVVGSYSVVGGCIYYGQEDGLCRYSMEDKTTEVIVQENMQSRMVILSGEYIVLVDDMKDKAVYIYDYSGKQIGQAPGDFVMCYGGNDKYIFAMCVSENGYPVQGYLDMEKISADMQWQEL